MCVCVLWYVCYIAYCILVHSDEEGDDEYSRYDKEKASLLLTHCSYPCIASKYYITVSDPDTVSKATFTKPAHYYYPLHANAPDCWNGTCTWIPALLRFLPTDPESREARAPLHNRF